MIETEPKSHSTLQEDAGDVAAPSAVPLSPASRLRYTWWLFAAVFAFLLLVSLATLMSVPAPFVDEGWNANRSWALLHTGHPFGTMDSGVFERYPGYWTYFPLLASVVHAVSIGLLGPSLFAMRIVSLVFGALILLIIYAVGRKLYDSNVGTLAMVLTALSIPFVLASHLGRHDIVVTALGYGALWLYLLGDPARVPHRSFLAGLAIGLTLDIHPNGIVFAPAVAALYLLEYGWRRVLAQPRFWAYVGGGLLGLAWFVALHILPYAQSYFALFSLGNGGGRTPPASNPFALAASVAQAVYLLGPLPAVLVVLSLAGLWLKRSASDTRLLVFFCVLVVTFGAVVRGKPVFYEALIAPAAGLLTAAFLMKLWRLDWKSRQIKLLGGGIVWGLAAASVAFTGLALLSSRPNDYGAVLDKIRAAVPSNASVLGAQTYYFALPAQRYLSWEQIVYYMRDTPGSNFADALRALHPDYLLFDDFVLDALVDDSATVGAPTNFLSISKPEFDSFVQKYATLTTIPTEQMGDIRLYKLNWSGQGAPALPAPTWSACSCRLQ